MESWLSKARSDGVVVDSFTVVDPPPASSRDRRGVPLTPLPSLTLSNQSYLTPSWYDSIQDFETPVVSGATSPQLLPPVHPWTSPPTDGIVVSSKVLRPLSQTYVTPPNPWHGTKVQRPLPVKLERLGPLRHNTASSQEKADHDKPEEVPPPRVSYATIARLGASRVSPQTPPTFGEITPPKPLVMAGTTQVKAQAEPRGEDTDYKKLICDALQNDNVSLAEEHLCHTILHSKLSSRSVAPDGYCYNRVISAYAQQGQHQKAQRVWDAMWTNYLKDGNPRALPNKQCFTGVMKAWQNSNNKYQAPEVCEKLLQTMYTLYDDTGNLDFKPDLYAYTVVFHCWADSNRDDAICRAFRTFRAMMDRCDRGEKDLTPDNVCFSNLINVLLNHNDQDKDDSDISKIERAEALFEEMLEFHFAGNVKAAPTIRNFNTILAAWSKSSSSEAVYRARDFVHNWETYHKDGKVSAKPDSYSYSLLLKCGVGKGAMEMLQSMILHIKTISQAHESSLVRLRAIKFRPVIMAFIKNKSTQWAHDLLLHMIRIHKRSPGNDTKPEIKWFQSIATMWSRYPNAEYAADHAASLLDALESLYKFDKSIVPNVYVYNSVLFTFRNAHQPYRAQALLEKMERRSKTLHIASPNKTSYHVVLQAWQAETHVGQSALPKICRLTKDYRKRFGHLPPKH